MPRDARGNGLDCLLAPLPGKLIGIARIDDERAGVAEGERGAAPLDFGRWAFAVRRNPRNRRAGREFDECEVAAAPVLIARPGNAWACASDGRERREGGGEGGGGQLWALALRS